MIIPEQPGILPAGEYPAHIVAACLACEVDPGSLLAWSVRKDGVSIILPTGQKVTFEIEGPWHARQLRLPFETDLPPAAGLLPKVGAFDPPEACGTKAQSYQGQRKINQSPNRQGWGICLVTGGAGPPGSR